MKKSLLICVIVLSCLTYPADYMKVLEAIYLTAEGNVLYRPRSFSFRSGDVESLRLSTQDIQRQKAFIDVFLGEYTFFDSSMNGQEVGKEQLQANIAHNKRLLNEQKDKAFQFLLNILLLPDQNQQAYSAGSYEALTCFWQRGDPISFATDDHFGLEEFKKDVKKRLCCMHALRELRQRYQILVMKEIFDEHYKALERLIFFESGEKQLSTVFLKEASGIHKNYEKCIKTFISSPAECRVGYAEMVKDISRTEYKKIRKENEALQDILFLKELDDVQYESYKKGYLTTAALLSKRM